MELPILYAEPINWKRVILMYDSALEEINTKINVLNKEFKPVSYTHLDVYKRQLLYR